MAPMTTRRLGVAVAVLGGYLYAIGGSDGQCLGWILPNLYSKILFMSFESSKKCALFSHICHTHYLEFVICTISDSISIAQHGDTFPYNKTISFTMFRKFGDMNGLE